MSWIKDNKFAAMLGGATLAGAIVLIYIGMIYHGRYATALDNYGSAAEEVKQFEGIPLYPSVTNRQGKTKALNTYREAITGMETAFAKFRPKELKNIAPQSFTDHAKTANEEVAKAFETAGTKLPEAFFLGFESYTTSLPREDATGLLDYQLGATKDLMLALAKAAPSQLANLYRPKFPEEDGEKWLAGPNDAARAFPMEVTFKGSEHAVRDFLNAIANSPDYFFVVRSVRIMNEKQTGPKVADAKFEAPPAAAGSAGHTSDPFSTKDGFVLPEEFPSPPEPTPPPATAPTPAPARTPAAIPGRTPATIPGRTPATIPGRTPAITPRPPVAAPPKPPVATPKPPVATPKPPVATPTPAAAPASDSSRILNRVLGSEELEVFFDIDVLEFLPVKALPAVPKSQP